MNDVARNFVKSRFADQHGADPCVDYPNWKSVGHSEMPGAALAFRGADEHTLFLESYFNQPIEEILSGAIGGPVYRHEIVEIGCLAAASSPALLRLWVETAQTLMPRYSFAVATLTRPLRAMFARVGMPIIELAAADPARLNCEPKRDWGRYYDLDPMVCVGEIRAGSGALARFDGMTAI